MPRSESSQTRASTIEGFVSSGKASYIGWTSSIGSCSDYVSRCSSVYTTWHLDICRHCVSPSTVFLANGTCAQLIAAIWIFPVSDCPHTDHAHSRMLIQPSGTHFLSMSQTVTSLSLSLSVSLDLQTPSKIFPVLLLLAYSARLRFVTKSCAI